MQNKSSDRFTVEYQITTQQGQDIEQIANDIAIEQTVEVPKDCIPKGHFTQGIIGQVERIESLVDSSNIFSVSISFRSDITDYSVPQLLNVLYGNISLKNSIVIKDINLSASLHKAFDGPNYGILGLRELLGVFNRPLAATALKPMGLSIDELAQSAISFVKGGVDIIKDDHSIANQSFHPFKERVSRCQEAITQVNDKTKGNTLYFPMVNGGFDEIEEQVTYALGLGIKGILIAPFLVGPDTVRYLAQKYPLVIMGHPAFTGTHFHDIKHGITSPVLLGTLFRLMGVDISIFPHTGGRFFFTDTECQQIDRNLKRHEGSWNPSLPCPAGGITLEKIEDLKNMYGTDCMYLIGGALIRNKEKVEETTIDFMHAIRTHFSEHRVEPKDRYANSPCDDNKEKIEEKSNRILRFENYHWSNRQAQTYKHHSKGSFKQVSRHELIGAHGENTTFDLRYFEIESGGYTSLEKHEHEHVIIGVRGQGIVIKDTSRTILSVNDVLYIAPHQSHQLRNEDTEPFGFYCIVDHKRDKPVLME